MASGGVARPHRRAPPTTPVAGSSETSTTARTAARRARGIAAPRGDAGGAGHLRGDRGLHRRAPDGTHRGPRARPSLSVQDSSRPPSKLRSTGPRRKAEVLGLDESHEGLERDRAIARVGEQRHLPGKGPRVHIPVPAPSGTKSSPTGRTRPRAGESGPVTLHFRGRRRHRGRRAADRRLTHGRACTCSSSAVDHPTAGGSAFPP